jgi:hypothetical protein
VYVAEKLGVALGMRVPHAGEQGPAVLVSVQETPALAESSVTVAFTVIAAPFTVSVENLLVIVTEMGGGRIVKLKLSLLPGSRLEVTAIAGEAFAPVGTVAGGWYAAVSAGAGLTVNVPHCGEQLTPPARSVQETPELVGSLIVTVESTTGPPAVWVVNLGAMLKEIGGVI